MKAEKTSFIPGVIFLDADPKVGMVFDYVKDSKFVGTLEVSAVETGRTGQKSIGFTHVDNRGSIAYGLNKCIVKNAQ